LIDTDKSKVARFLVHPVQRISWAINRSHRSINPSIYLVGHT